MNHEELKEQKINEYEQKLRNNEQVKPFWVFPYRFELRERLKDDENASYELEKLIDFVNESL